MTCALWHGGPGAVELGVAEGEHPAVGRHQPVPAAVGRGRHADDGLVEVNGPGGTVELRRAEGEHPAVGGHQPVAPAVGRHGHAHDRLVERDVAGAAAVPLAPEGEHPAVGGHGQIAVGRRRGYLACRHLRRGRPGEPAQLRIVMELRPSPGLGDQGAVGAVDREVLHHALDVVVGAVRDSEVPGHRDADGAVGVIGDQGRVLESVDLPGRHPAVARPVVHVDQLGPGLPVENLEACGRGDDHILVAVPTQVGCRHRADDPADRRDLPDDGAGAGVEGPHRTGAVVLVGALYHGEPAVPLHVGQGRAPAGGAVELLAPDRVAARVEHLDRVLVATRVEGSRPGGNAERSPGQDRAHGGGRVDLLVGVGGADEATMVVEDAQVPPVLVVLPVGEAGRGGTTDDDLVLPGAVEIAHGRRGEHAVGREEGPPAEQRPVRGPQRVGPLAQRSGDHEGGTAGGTHRRRGLDADIGKGIGRRVGGKRVPQQRATGPVGVVAALGGVGGVPGVEIQVVAGGCRHHRRGGVDRRVARHA